MRKYAQYAAAVAGVLFFLAVVLWANTSAVNECRKSELPYSVLCDQIAKQFTGD
jgi:hypothetical protein